MSKWTYIRGTILVEPMGRTEPEREYILKTVLEHLPRVHGSEGNMQVLISQPGGHNFSTSHDEFDIFIPTYYDEREHQQTQYILTLYGNLRDTVFSETVRNLSKFLSRLSKRVPVDDILIRVDDGGFWGHYGNKLIISNPEPYSDMFETPSWNWDREYKLPCFAPMYNDPNGNWCEYLLWENFKETSYPKKLLKKLGYEVDEDGEEKEES